MSHVKCKSKIEVISSLNVNIETEINDLNIYEAKFIRLKNLIVAFSRDFLV